MKTLALRILSILVTLVSVADLVFANGHRVEAPVYQEGQFWEFTVGEYDYSTKSSVFLNGDYKVFFSNGQFKISDGGQVSARGAGILMAMVNKDDNRGGDFRGGNFLTFPLVLGEKKDPYEYITTRIGLPYQVRATAEIKVVGFEEITVPAGKFRAVRIERDDKIWWRVGEPGYRKTTYFYSPLTKTIIRLFYRNTEERRGSDERTEVELKNFGPPIRTLTDVE